MNEKKATSPDANGTEHATASTAGATSASASASSTDQQPAAEATLVDQVLEQGRQWINDSSLGQRLNDLPQAAIDLGNRAVDRVKNLTTTQKIVGGAILAAGLGWLATRGRSAKSDDRRDDTYAAAGGTRPGSHYAGSAAGRWGNAGNDSRRGVAGRYGNPQPGNTNRDNRNSYQQSSNSRSNDADGFGTATDE